MTEFSEIKLTPVCNGFCGVHCKLPTLDDPIAVPKGKVLIDEQLLDRVRVACLHHSSRCEHCADLHNEIVELASTAPEFRPDMVAVPRKLLRECEDIITDYASGYSCAPWPTEVLRKLRKVMGDD